MLADTNLVPEDSDTDPFVHDILSRWQLCRFCRHLHNLVGKLTCNAFPEGIPRAITSGTILHAEPLAGQKNHLSFSPV